MEVLLRVPDEIAEKIQVRPEDLPRRALESLVADSYRAGKITAGEVQRMLGFDTRMQTDAFLKERGAYLDYSEEDFQRDIDTLRRLSGR
jgi:predicted HTH domain antitoxin